MSGPAIELIRATRADIAFVMATERTPGYEDLVGRWERQQHETAIADSRYVYFLGLRDGEPIGFSIVRDRASPDRVTYIKRIIVSDKDRGLGRALLTKIVDAIFDQTDAYRVWLGVLTHNTRAQTAYAAIGFRTEGVARGASFFRGEQRDGVTMAGLRPEWRQHA